MDSLLYFTCLTNLTVRPAMKCHDVTSINLLCWWWKLPPLFCCRRSCVQLLLSQHIRKKGVLTDCREQHKMCPTSCWRTPICKTKALSSMSVLNHLAVSAWLAQLCTKTWYSVSIQKDTNTERPPLTGNLAPLSKCLSTCSANCFWVLRGPVK